MDKRLYLVFGAVFGFVLSLAGATTFDFYAKLFLFEDLQLMWVICAAAAVGALGVALLRRRGAKALAGGAPLTFEGKPMKTGLLGGSFAVGVGWGLAGACPGTALAMLGQGKLIAAFAVAGILLGTWLFGLQQGAAVRREPAARPAGVLPGS